MDCGRAGWTVDPHFSTLASQRKKTGRIRGCFGGNSRILEWETQTTCEQIISMWGESIPRPRTLVDTNDSLRARALHTMVTELDLTVTNTWMNADTERELFTRSSWSNLEDSLIQMHFIMTWRKLDMKQVQVLDSDWFKTDHRAVLAVLSLRPKMRYPMRNGANLRGWEPDDSWHKAAAETQTDCKSWNKMVPSAYGNGGGSQKIGNKGDVSDRIGAQNTFVENEENRTIPRAIRFDMALSRNLEKEKSVETRETFGQDQGECGDGESPQENAEQAFQVELDCKRQNPESVLTKFFQDPYSIPEDQEESTQSE